MKQPEIVFHPKALEEFRKSFIWYNEQQPGLGRRFEIAVEDILTRISEHPDYFTMTKSGFRQAVIEVFPFAVIYKQIPKQGIVYVSSIFHTGRNPKGSHRIFPG